jgi:hypothetical protein
VRPDIEREVLDRVAEFSQSRKAWGGNLSWRSTTHRSNAYVQAVIPLFIGGAAKSGFQARLSARTDMAERDVYAQLELWCPEIEKYLHFDRVEWKPIRPHSNPQTAPAGLRGRILMDRQYPFLLNRRLGIPGLLQAVTLVAKPLPDGLQTFNDLCGFLSTMWALADSSPLPEPPWQERLL